jgi:hypothetical protein
MVRSTLCNKAEEAAQRKRLHSPRRADRGGAGVAFGRSIAEGVVAVND